jgi:hypothetical protein
MITNNSIRFRENNPLREESIIIKSNLKYDIVHSQWQKTSTFQQHKPNQAMPSFKSFESLNAVVGALLPGSSPLLEGKTTNRSII